MSMNQKVGIADKGMASALISVARQSRRNRNTTTTARIAPSIIASIELRYCSLVYSVRVNRILKSTFGLFFLICSSFFRSEEHTSELQSLMRISYAVFCLKKKKNITTKQL